MAFSFLSTYEQRELISNTLILLIGISVFFTLLTRVIKPLTKKNTGLLPRLYVASIALTLCSLTALLIVEFYSPIESEKVAYKADLHINLEDQVSQIVENSKETMVFHEEDSIAGLNVFEKNTVRRKIRKPLLYNDSKDMVIWGDAVSEKFIRLTVEAFGKKAHTNKSKRISIVPHQNLIATLDISYHPQKKATALFADLYDSCRVLKTIGMYAGSCTIKSQFKKQVLSFLDKKQVSARHPEDRYLMLCPYTHVRNNFSISSCLDLQNASEISGTVVVSIKKITDGMALGMKGTPGIIG